MRVKLRRSCALVGAVVLLAGLSTMPPAGAAVKCFGKRVTIKGTSGRDRLRGTPRADVIAGRGGNDEIQGLGGNDLICAGGGNDHVHGGPGNDKIAGQQGEFDGLGGDDGNDLLRAGAGGFRFLEPGPGDDVVVGSQRSLDLIGFFEAPGPVQANLTTGTATGEGQDVIRNGDGLLGSMHDDVLTGTASGNFFEGGPGNDEIFTGGNSATLTGGPEASAEADFVAPDFFAPWDAAAPRGDDTVTGGDGIEVMLYDGAAQGLDVNLNSGIAKGEGTDTLSNVEAVIASHFDDILTGDNNDNAFEPLGGQNDVNGGPGEDVAVYLDALAGVTVNLDTGSASGTFRSFDAEGNETSNSGSDNLMQMENVWGSPEDDSLTGDESANDIYAEDGNDSVSGGIGDDLLIGGPGSDTLDGGEGTDQCDGESENGCESDPSTRSSRFTKLSFAAFSNFLSFVRGL